MPKRHLYINHKFITENARNNDKPRGGGQAFVIVLLKNKFFSLSSGFFREKMSPITSSSISYYIERKKFKIKKVYFHLFSGGGVELRGHVPYKARVYDALPCLQPFPKEQ